MREIKFRGRNRQGDWFIGMLNKWTNVHGDIVYAIITPESVETVDADSVGQFTGLNVKGVDVYGGDIVQTDVNKKMWEVVLNDFTWRFNNYRIKEIIQLEVYTFAQYLHLLGKANAKIQVIGNVTDNPELLNGKK